MTHESMGSPQSEETTISSSFEEFYGAEVDRLLRVMSVICGSYQEAEDIAQEAFVKVLEHWERVASHADPKGYLYRTAINLMRNRHRRTSIALRRAVGAITERDVFTDVEDRVSISAALARLTPRQRAALVLTEMLGYSTEETGRLLGVSASTVRALTFQGRSALRKTGSPDDD